MKNVFSIGGFLIFLHTIEDMIIFYTSIFTEADNLQWWVATKGVLGTALFIYLLFGIVKWIYKVLKFWYDPDPNAEIEL